MHRPNWVGCIHKPIDSNRNETRSWCQMFIIKLTIGNRFSYIKNSMLIGDEQRNGDVLLYCLRFGHHMGIDLALNCRIAASFLRMLANWLWDVIAEEIPPINQSVTCLLDDRSCLLLYKKWKNQKNNEKPKAQPSRNRIERFYQVMAELSSAAWSFFYFIYITSKMQIS